MGIREKINQNPKPYVIGASVVLILGLGLIVWSMMGGRIGGGASGKPIANAFYSLDEKTWFPDAYEKIADPNFKGARAYVFQYPGGQPFIGYLETYTDAGKQALAQYYSDASKKGTPPPEIYNPEKLVKKPAQENWLQMGVDAQAIQIPVMEKKDGESPMAVWPEK